MIGSGLVSSHEEITPNSNRQIVANARLSYVAWRLSRRGWYLMTTYANSNAPVRHILLGGSGPRAGLSGLERQHALA